MMLQMEYTASPEWPSNIEERVNPNVLFGKVPGNAIWASPELIHLKPEVKPVAIKQYPFRKKAKKELQIIIDKFMKYGLLRPTKSAFNTLILAVKKPNGMYQLVQDLRAINVITEDLHQLMSNPYTILAGIRETDEWFTVLDLKDAFYCIKLAEESQNLFAFEWGNTQLTWTILVQGHKNLPTLVSQALKRDLGHNSKVSKSE